VSQDLVSVIMVVRNGEPYFNAAMESVLSQDYRPIEILVIDGQSTDKTAEIARSYPLVRYLYQEKTGLAEARNMGIGAARGEYIAFLDCDDLWSPGKLKAQVAYLQQHPQVEAVVSLVKVFLEPGTIRRPGFNRQAFEGKQVGYTPSALLARKVLFQEFGVFNNHYLLGCDADWFARALDTGVILSVLQAVLVHKRIHDGNLSGNLKLSRSETLRFLRESLRRKRVAAVEERLMGSGGSS
jgi:glycosyltransferase involved in cell wall biosynthesis